MRDAVFLNDLEQRGVKVVKLLTSIVLGLAVVTSVILVVTLIKNPSLIQYQTTTLALVSNFSVTIFLVWLRFYLVKKAYRIAFLFFLILQGIATFISVAVSGTYSPVPIILIVIGVLSTGIVIGVKSGTVVLVINVILLWLVYILHSLNIIGVHPYDTSTTFSGNIILTGILAVISLIVSIGYAQIQHSYQKASDYAEELQELNRSLDLRVKQKTKQLRQSFDLQLESMHSSAIMGRITRAMLHDIATPISALSGALSLTKENKPEQAQELLRIMQASVDQLTRVTNNARDLVAGKDVIEVFSPSEVIEIAIGVNEHYLQKGNIKIDIQIDHTIRLTGVAAIFERIVINLVNNAIEELIQCPPEHNKKITIRGEQMNNRFNLQIEDTGRGIPKELLHKIFQPEFSLKNTGSNTGFGLAFVKSSIKDKFNGDIKVESELDTYTRFTLDFPVTNVGKDQITI